MSFNQDPKPANAAPKDIPAAAVGEVEGTTYDAVENLSITARGNDTVDLVFENEVASLRFDQWLKSIASTSQVGMNPQLIDILDFALTSSPEWVDWLAGEVSEARDMYEVPPGA